MTIEVGGNQLVAIMLRLSLISNGGAQPTGGVRRNASENGQICRSTAVGVVRGAGSCRHPTTVLSGGPKSANIHVSWETIWEIPVKMSKKGGSICPRIK